jgi:hypothetical protein
VVQDRDDLMPGIGEMARHRRPMTPSPMKPIFIFNSLRTSHTEPALQPNQAV